MIDRGSISRSSRLALGLCVGLVIGSATGARADGIVVTDVATLPATPTEPYLWGDLSGLSARIANPKTAGYYATFKGYVDARLTTIATADDDTRARFAKAAALLHVLGQTPPSGPYASYRDAAVVAITGIGLRVPFDNAAYVVVPPPNLINILQDSSRLQSLAEAYDLLRDSSVSPANDTAMRGKLANWADAIRGDWQLIGFGGFPPHRDNWAIKGGAALLTTALAMPDHASAATWRLYGMTFINDSLTAVASTTGWFRESPWYLNYSLANLLPTAWHVKNTTGIDWFGALRPFVEASLAWRQPGGHAPPFEEGLRNVFPWDIAASGWPDLAPQMLWAWDQSDKNDENFENQQFHEVTRFILADLTTVAAAPETSPTRFIGGDARIAVLADGWESQAFQLTTITANDHSISEANASRHNMRNPMDVMIHARGGVVVPPATGGPQVTSTSPASLRAMYLSPLAKNIPLIGKNAPFITASDDVRFGGRLDSPTDAHPARLADLARTEVRNVYAANTTVVRSVGLIDEGYAIAVDRFALPAAAELDLSWRGRGTKTATTIGPNHLGWRWTSGGPTLDLDVVGNGPINVESNASKYAPQWNVEEDIDGVLVGRTAANAAFITVFQAGEVSPRSITEVGDAGAAAVAVSDPLGSIIDTIIAPVGTSFAAVAGVGTDGSLAITRADGNGLVAFCLQEGTALSYDGAVLVAASAPLTMCLTITPGGFVAEVSPDSAGVTVEIALPGYDPGRLWTATHDGAAATLSQSQTGLTFTTVPGTLVVDSTSGCAEGIPSGCDGVVFGTVRRPDGSLGSFRCRLVGDGIACDLDDNGDLEISSLLQCE